MRRARCWEPSDRAKGDQLVIDVIEVLLKLWKEYQDADETGWRYRVMWKGEQAGCTMATGRTSTAMR